MKATEICAFVTKCKVFIAPDYECLASRFKEKTMKLRNILFGACAVFAFSAPAFAQGMMPPPPNAGGHFEMVDANKDGFLTKDEIKAAHMKKFDAIDANRDGFLLKEEMKSYHQGQMKNRMEMRQDRRMDHLDANNDGAITKQEWVDGPERARKMMADRMAKRFDELDVNKDGKLNADEMKNMKMRDKMHGPGKMDRKMGEMRPKFDPDSNKDGKISRAEWMAMPMPLFDNADANNDGKISRDEARSAMMKGANGKMGKHHGHGEGGFMPKGQ